MLFSEVLGLDHLKSHLFTGVQNNRIPHAQLFVGTGLLPLAIAYASYILSQNNADNDRGLNETAKLKVSKLSHPDLHFAFPVATTDTVKSHPVSDNFAEEWRNFIFSNPYGNVFDWYNRLGIEKKQGQISVDEAQEIVKRLSLKSYEGGFKVMIIWMAEKMNTSCSNKLLKLIEEPPDKTIFLLLAEDEEQIISTILSRCQVLKVPLLAEEVIARGLQEREGATYEIAKNCARQAGGDYNKALHFFKDNSEETQFEDWVIFWVRSAFRARGNKSVIQDLLTWSENVAGTGREIQKKFLSYCVSFFRQALLLNYQAPSLVYLQFKDVNFGLEKFAPFIHGGNVMEIIEELENASYHIERNGNAKIIFTDLSIKLTRLLHKKP